MLASERPTESGDLKRAPKPEEQKELRFRHATAPFSVDPTRALIYMWVIQDKSGQVIGRYVGKAGKGAKRPLTHYRRNIDNILNGRPYRKSNPSGFRRIHRALAEAVIADHHICLFFLRNVETGENINEVERSLILKHKSSGTESWQLND